MSNLCLGQLAESTGFLLHLAQISDHERFAGYFSDSGITPGTFSILTLIDKNPGVPQGLIADALKIKPARMTKAIKRLVDRGLVSREIPDSNRRIVKLSLTALGLRYLESYTPLVEQFIKHDMSGLTNDEKEQLNGLLRKMIK